MSHVSLTDRGSTTDAVCPPGTQFARAVDAVRHGDLDVDQAVAFLVGSLTDGELLGLLDGDQSFQEAFSGAEKRYNAVPYEAGRVDRLGIPGIRFTDGPRGVVVGSSTAFPVAIARAATFDPELEQAVGDAIGAEARAHGANLFAGICINLAYSPGWGRAQESYGEDPVLLGTMGAALARGVSPWVLACVKHFALNSMEEARFRVDVQVDEDVLHEVYLPHFRSVVEAGVDSVMSAYNAVNGEWAGQHRHLLTKILREQWGFGGFVMTDFIWGLRDPVGSVAAGQDLEMPFRQQRAATLPDALRDGTLARADVERSAHRVLGAQVELARRARPTPPSDVVACAEHRRLAREVASRGSVLLRNERVDGRPALPLDERSLRRLAVVGPLVDRRNQGDVGSSRVYPPTSATILDGLRERLGDRVEHLEHADPEKAARVAADADAAVVVIGLSSRDEGESLAGVDAATMRLLGGPARVRPVAAVLGKVVGAVARRSTPGGDRRDLRLHAEDVALARAVAAANPRTIVVIIAGGTVVLDPWDADVAAILLAWYPGMEGGRAVADVLFGDAEPTGRLPVAIPHHPTDLPVLDWDGEEVTYRRWWGQRKLDHDATTAAYPFGFGLGYTSFASSEIEVGAVAGECFTVSARVRNTGQRPGRHVVQVYALLPDEDRPVRALVGFRSVAVDPGRSARVAIECTTRPLQRWTPEGFVVGPATVTVEVAAYSGDPAAVATTLDVPALTR